MVIRSYRKLGTDLQRLVHQDMKNNFAAYPSKRILGLRNMRLSPKDLWRTGCFVIEAMLTGGLVARRKALTKSTEYPVRPVGWVTKGPTPLSDSL